MRFFTVCFSRPRGYQDPHWHGDDELEEIIDAPDGSQIVELSECPCGVYHSLGIQSPDGDIIYCADYIRTAKPGDEKSPWLGRWS